MIDNLEDEPFKNKEEYINFLEQSVIPTLKEEGDLARAMDLEMAIRFMKDAPVLKIIDEMCTCGCYKSQHMGVHGHGMCGDPVCGCKQFTWKGFVYMEVLP